MFANSLLARPAETTSAPFPHLRIDEALSKATCEQLIAEFPPLQLVAGGDGLGNNQRFSYPARLALNDPKLSPLWREFIGYHVSTEFWRQICFALNPGILQLYPDFEERFGIASDFRVGVRGVHSFADVDVLLDAQISINTPVLGASSSVRRAHVDQPNKLIFGLYYLRLHADDSAGGDLEIYAFKDREDVFRDVYVAEKFLNTRASVPYHANQLLIGVNSHRSLHGVSDRAVTHHPRLFVNLVAEVKAPLFSLAAYRHPPNAFERVTQAVRRRLGQPG